MLEEVFAVVQSMGVGVVKMLPVSVALGAVFTLLSVFWACNPGRPWWHKRDLVTDLCYWFLIPLFAQLLSHRPPRHRCGISLRHHHARGAGRVL
jgi:hypothetical protein